MLLNQADPHSPAKVIGKLWEWREPGSASIYSSLSRRCRSLISYAIAKAVGLCPGRLKLFDAAKVRVGRIKQLQSSGAERRDAKWESV